MNQNPIEHIEVLLAEGRYGDVLEFAPAAIELARSERDAPQEFGLRMDYLTTFLRIGQVREAELQLREMNALVSRHQLPAWRSSRDDWRMRAALCEICSAWVLSNSGVQDRAFAAYSRGLDALEKTLDEGWYGLLRRLLAVIGRLRRLVPVIWVALFVLYFSAPLAGILRYGDFTSWLTALTRGPFGEVTPYIYAAYFPLILLWPVGVFALEASMRSGGLSDLRKRTQALLGLADRLRLDSIWTTIDLGQFTLAERQIQAVKTIRGSLPDEDQERLAYAEALLAYRRSDLSRVELTLRHLTSDGLAPTRLRADAHHLLCATLIDRERLEEATGELARMESLLNRMPTESGWHRALLENLRGILAAKATNWETAANHYEAALKLLEDYPSSLDLPFHIGFRLGCARSLLGLHEAANDALRKAVEQLEGGRLALVGGSARHLLSLQYSSLLRILAVVQTDAGDVVGAEETLVQFKARTLVDSARAVDLELGEGPDRALSQLDDAVQDAARRQLVAPQLAVSATRNLGSDETDLSHALEARRERLVELRLKEGIPMSLIGWIELADVQSCLSLDECVVDILWSEYGVYTFVILRDSVRGWRWDFSDASRLLEDLGQSTESPVGLLRALLGDLHSDVRSCKRVFLIPDGPLSRINFGCVFGPETQLAILPGASLLPVLRSSRRNGLGSIVVKSDPRNDLPGVDYEVRQIGRYTTGAIDQITSSSNADANLTEILGRKRNVAVVHFACHGWLSATKEDSGLLLEDGGQPLFLTIDDIERRCRLRADLVVLSACDVGQHTGESGALDVLGLPRTFFTTCRSAAIVASMQPLDDALAGLLMPRFYQRLSTGQSVGDALLGAMREVADLSRSHLYTFAEEGWPLDNSILARGGGTAPLPYSSIEKVSPYVIFGDPTLTLAPHNGTAE